MADETTGALVAAQIGVQSALDVLEAQGHFGTHANWDCKECTAIHRLDTALVQIRLALEASALAADPTRTKGEVVCVSNEDLVRMGLPSFLSPDDERVIRDRLRRPAVVDAPSGEKE